MNSLTQPQPGPRSTGTIVSAIEDNLFAFFLTLRGFRRTEMHDDRDVLWYRSDIPFPMFNAITRVRFSSEVADTRVDEINNAYREAEMPVLWWLTPSSAPADLAERLRRRGLEDAGGLTGMAVSLDAVNERIASPNGLQILRLRDTSLIERWVHVCGIASGFPDWVGEPLAALIAHIGLDNGPMRHYLAYLDGEPVATSSILFSRDVAGIYNVGTLPEARGKGIGRAISLAPLVEARSLGYQTAVLLATPMGEPIYRRLGFRQYCRTHWFISHP